MFRQHDQLDTAVGMPRQCTQNCFVLRGSSIYKSRSVDTASSMGTGWDVCLPFLPSVFSNRTWKNCFTKRRLLTSNVQLVLSTLVPGYPNNRATIAPVEYKGAKPY